MQLLIYYSCQTITVIVIYIYILHTPTLPNKVILLYDFALSNRPPGDVRAGEANLAIAVDLLPSCASVVAT
jgi:hypothetical protein